MSTIWTTRPRAEEHDPYYVGYVARVPEGDLCLTLEKQLAAAQRFIREIPEDRGNHRYGPEKWSVKEVLGHVIDIERIMSYRALRIARGDTTPLPGFDEQEFVPSGDFGKRTLRDLGEEWTAVRGATVALLKHFDETMLARAGTANDKRITARALGYVIAGHELHHLEVLRTRYL